MVAFHAQVGAAGQERHQISFLVAFFGWDMVRQFRLIDYPLCIRLAVTMQSLRSGRVVVSYGSFITLD